MRLFIAAVVGIAASFALTILSAVVLFDLENHGVNIRLMMWGIASPIIAVAVGSLVGLVARGERYRVIAAAGLALAPWAAWEFIKMNGSGPGVLRETIGIASVILYVVLGSAAAVWIGGLGPRRATSITPN